MVRGGTCEVLRLVELAVADDWDDTCLAILEPLCTAEYALLWGARSLLKPSSIVIYISLFDACFSPFDKGAGR
jgi:hypothetical protein